IASSRPSYLAAFERCMRNEQHLLSDEERMAMREVAATKIGGEARASLAEGGSGAYAVPFYLDSSIILTNTGSLNPFRAISRVEQISTNAWHGVSSAGASAEWTAESA